jgi:hypothetical protein
MVMGTKYVSGCVVVIKLEYGNPVFGLLDKIVIVDGRIVFFKYKLLIMLGHVEHLNAYSVELSDVTALVMQEKLVDYHPLSLCKGFGSNERSSFVNLRYRIDFIQ